MTVIRFLLIVSFFILSSPIWLVITIYKTGLLLSDNIILLITPTDENQRRKQ